MEHLKQETEQVLRQLFFQFIHAGLHGRFEEAIDLMIEQYLAAGMGEQGIVHGKEEARHILQDAYLPIDGAELILM